MTRFNFSPTPEPLQLLQGGNLEARLGRPRKATDAVAEEKVDDIEKIRDLGIEFTKNLMTNQIEYRGHDGEIATLEGDKLSYLGSELAMRCGQSLPDIRLKPAVTYLANENCVDPRVQFLERSAEEHEPSDDIHQLATIYFGNGSEIANLALKRMLIGAVARAFNHGCSMS